MHAKFSMKLLYKYPNVAKIVWYHQEHIYESGSPTHGTLTSNLNMQIVFR